MSKVAVQLLSYNGSAYLGPAIASLAEQTYDDFELYVLDNGSEDGSATLVDAAVREFPRPAHFVQEPKNLGFAGGHNKLFAMHDAPFVLCMNQDVTLAPHFLSELMAFMESHPGAAAVSGKLTRWGETVIDTAGLEIGRNRSVRDIGAGESDRGQFDGTREVFGVSGALPLYRRSAVLEASPDGTLFDGSYGSYKEDADLCWRLRIMGYKAYTVGSAIAAHARSLKTDGATLFGNHLQLHEDDRQRMSCRNHLLMVLKNEASSDFLRDAHRIIGFEFAKWGYLGLRRPSALMGLVETARALPDALRKRADIQSKRAASIRPWIV